MLRIRLIGVVVGSSLEDKVQSHIVVAIAHRAVDARQWSFPFFRAMLALLDGEDEKNRGYVSACQERGGRCLSQLSIATPAIRPPVMGPCRAVLGVAFCGKPDSASRTTLVERGNGRRGNSLEGCTLSPVALSGILSQFDRRCGRRQGTCQRRLLPSPVIASIGWSVNHLAGGTIDVVRHSWPALENIR